MNYKEANSPEIVKFWKQHINNNVSIGRDSSLIKRKLDELSPVQILSGMVRYIGEQTVSIPMFLREEDDWVNWNELECQAELARFISHHTPESYYVYMDLKNESLIPIMQEHFKKAIEDLQEWSERILE